MSEKVRTFAACNRNQNKKNNQNFFSILFILTEKKKEEKHATDWNQGADV